MHLQSSYFILLIEYKIGRTKLMVIQQKICFQGEEIGWENKTKEDGINNSIS